MVDIIQLSILTSALLVVDFFFSGRNKKFFVFHVDEEKHVLPWCGRRGLEEVLICGLWIWNGFTESIIAVNRHLEATLYQALTTVNWPLRISGYSDGESLRDDDNDNDTLQAKIQCVPSKVIHIFIRNLWNNSLSP